MSNAYDAVVFDFGGVVVDGPFDAFTGLEERAGVPRGSVRAVNSRNPDANAWACIERGEIDLETFVSRFEQEAREVGIDAARPRDRGRRRCAVPARCTMRGR